tara:strand:- start:312 stop:512 length:201 start_codon:yes stop_codon:yes gene_type:complete
MSFTTSAQKLSSFGDKEFGKAEYFATVDRTVFMWSSPSYAQALITLSFFFCATPILAFAFQDYLSF